MAVRTDGTSRGPGRQTEAAPPPLPDLTGLTLRALRTCDDPAVTAVVENTLRDGEELSRMWRSGTKGGEGVDGEGHISQGASRAGERKSVFQTISGAAQGSGGRTGTAGGRGAGRQNPL
ncbi:hypothetical protein [Streptomyces sp. PU-14G]|uniref:hypothetical protein n=1 Tax=Streptomyces sp. PU-14G TaxID=2800808 RepID=UPI0034DE9E23